MESWSSEEAWFGGSARRCVKWWALRKCGIVVRRVHVEQYCSEEVRIAGAVRRCGLVGIEEEWIGNGDWKEGDPGDSRGVDYQAAGKEWINWGLKVVKKWRLERNGLPGGSERVDKWEAGEERIGRAGLEWIVMF